MDEYKAFSLSSSGLMYSLQTNIFVYPVKSDEKTIPRMWNGLWDTGASNSSIDKRVAEYLGLESAGKVCLSTANGDIFVDSYFVNIGLPNGVIVENLFVSESDLGDEIDVLIGMDVISKGDFSITNFNGKTTFSFRIPSIEDVDFVKKAKS